MLEDSYSPPGTAPPSLLPPGKERAHMGLGIRATSRLCEGKTKQKQESQQNLMKHIAALGVSQVRVRCVSDSGRDGQALRQRQQSVGGAPRI